MPSYTQNLGLVKGEKGATGPAGAAATIQVGTVTTGAAGSQATVTNVGTENAAILNFTIPQGQQGVPGTTPSTDNFVTTNTDQTITGEKIFNDRVRIPTKVTNPNEALIINSNNGEHRMSIGYYYGFRIGTTNPGGIQISTKLTTAGDINASSATFYGKNGKEVAYNSDLTALQDTVDTHVAKKDNPHSVTKTQVGLGNVDNVRQYSASNPPPYPVTSVNSKTGAVVLSASDVGALTKTQADGYYQAKGTYLSSIPVATSSSLGGVKVGSGTASGTNFNLLLDSNQVGIVSIPTATTSAPGLMSSTDKSKLNGLPSSISYPVTSVNSKTGAVVLSASDVGALTKTLADGYYQPKGSYLTSIPTASTGSLGGIKVGYTTSGKNYAVKVDTSGNAYVNVPWADNNTTYSFSNGSDGSFTVTPSGGQAQKVSTGALTKSSADGYYQPKGSYLTSIPAATTSTIGGVKLGDSTTQTVAANSVSATASRTYAIQQNSSGQLVVNVPWKDSNTDTKVAQKHSTENVNYPILLKNGTGTGNVTSTTLFDANVYVNPSTGTLTASKVYGAVFNDYAEYRKCEAHIDPGYIVTEEGNDCIKLCTTKKNKGKLFVVTDTYGTCIGEKIDSVPVALTGRVLVHYDHKRKIKIGDYIGCNDKGQARKMSKIEAFLHPERVVGTVSSIPDYDTWGTDNVKVDGRIWVNIV